MNTALAQRNFDASIMLMNQARIDCSVLPPLSATTTAQLIERAKIVRAALNARSLFRDVRARAEALSEALVRFRQRKARFLGK
jgi:hypothetical protein